MTDLRAAAQQALEALKMMLDEYGEANCPACDHADAAIYALKEALVEDAMQKFTDVNKELEAALAEHDKNLAGFKERKANWDIQAPRSPRDLQCKLAEETQERDRQRRGYEEQRLAALAEPVQEPVAWRWGYRSVTTGEMDWRGYVEIPAHPNLRSPEIIMQPLYAAPPQRPAEPLTEEEIQAAWDSVDMRHPRGNETRIAFARAIERAHGVGEQP